MHSSGDTEEEVPEQINKTNRISECLVKYIIWRNTHLRSETKAKTYRIVVRPNMTYTAETGPDSTRTKRLMETCEMKIVRNITGKSLWNRQRSIDLRQSCNMNINGWTLKRTKEWYNHLSRSRRMGEGRLVKIARDRSPNGRRSIGRPRKKWSDNLDIC
ncbi:uncharacterized protein LOC126880959 [Diabrotica virgifera virgifera]|uniref:Uncharacterized protein n=1 Tax=Diabrotica virgifera virgifera TaxID=50390 RepID=A0ABM5JSS7_DIAVI|nr:uncharacterized protein LOC126880959 [Diabrotica virgifera virgifera]